MLFKRPHSDFLSLDHPQCAMVHRPQVDQRLTRRTHHPCGDTHPSDQHLHHEGTYVCGLYVDFPSVECLEDQASMYTCLYSAPDCLFLSDSLFSLYSLTLLSHFHLPLFLPPSPPPYTPSPVHRTSISTPTAWQLWPTCLLTFTSFSCTPLRDWLGEHWVGKEGFHTLLDVVRVCVCNHCYCHVVVMPTDYLNCWPRNTAS